MALKDLWFEFFNHEIGVCGLCGNSGEINTKGHLKSPRGLECGIENRYCICPNGRKMKRHFDREKGNV